MRNTKEFPVTSDEILTTLDQIKSELNSELIGDMRSLILSYLKEYLVENQKSLDKFLESK